MKKNAIILHGWYQKKTENWYPWLKNELTKKEYATYLPQIPTFETKLPELNSAMSLVIKNTNITKKTTIIGHSLGCLLALRLAEILKFDKLILISGWDYDELTDEHRLFWMSKINHQKIIKNVKKVYCISSDNDPYTTAFHTKKMNNRLKGKFILIPKAGHFTSDDGITKIPK
ncbi:RBBP9/YdeN family alpha/beta hydrolase, partial [Patescibacteria group bacterium]